MALPLIINPYSAIIIAGQSLSGAVPMGADTLAALWMPPAWTPADITFQVSPDGGISWCDLYNQAGSPIEVNTPQSGSFIMFSTHASYMWRGINMLKVRSGTASAPVPQAAGATITLIGRPEIF